MGIVLINILHKIPTFSSLQDLIEIARQASFGCSKHQWVEYLYKYYGYTLHFSFQTLSKDGLTVPIDDGTLIMMISQQSKPIIDRLQKPLAFLVGYLCL